MQRGGGIAGLRKWAALAVPGLSAGLGWTAAAGWPPLYRFFWGVGVGVAVYALVHFLLKSASDDRD